MIWLKDFCTQKVLDFISVAWGGLASLKLFWEFCSRDPMQSCLPSQE